MQPRHGMSLFCAFRDQAGKPDGTECGIQHTMVLECTLLVGVVFKRASEMNGFALTANIPVHNIDALRTLRSEVVTGW